MKRLVYTSPLTDTEANHERWATCITGEAVMGNLSITRERKGLFCCIESAGKVLEVVSALCSFLISSDANVK